MRLRSNFAHIPYLIESIVGPKAASTNKQLFPPALPKNNRTMTCNTLPKNNPTVTSNTILSLLLLCAVASSTHVTPTAAQIKQALQSIADAKSKTYNCSVSIAFKNKDLEVSAAAGVIDFGSMKQATVDDSFSWGSGTKPLTGASILKLISEGHFNLETPAHTIIDPLLLKSSKRDPTQKFKSMADLWGEDNVAHIVIGQMLNMTSGIPDFDTAKGHGAMTDSLRLELYNNPTKIYTPQELMAVPWVANSFKACVDNGPHWHKCYSSTNFMLLGLILANGTEWNKFDQATFLPPSLSKSLKFAVSGAPKVSRLGV
jgi:CubicO group peptidase (beta-lactamase class C family)